MSKVTAIRPRDSAGDQFDDIYDRMQAQLDALRCVGAIFDNPAIEGDEDLVAARGLFHRTFSELDRLHNEFATWYMGTKAEARVRP